jgi:hypothetical protein
MRIQRRTILIVHEGYAEDYLLKHLRALYVPRDSGLALSLQNARGGGGRHALDLALRVRRRTDFDEVALLVDTDQDWDETQRRRAKQSGIQAIESSPCLEAWLLRVNGYSASGSGQQIKREFERRYGGPAHDRRIYEPHFPRTALDAARAHMEVLDQLLRLMRV